MPHLETLLAHAGCTPDPATGAVVAPIHLATTFERGEDGAYPHGFVYSRTENPTRDLFETTLARLEGAGAADLRCAAFASGMAAAAAVCQALPSGTHVLLADDVYYGVRRLLQTLGPAWGLTWTEVDLADLDALDDALAHRAVGLVWAETPSNPMLKITDLAAVAARAHAAGALLAVDATWTTPLLQRPFDLGADVVVHSVTKYLGGHSDVLGGAVLTRAGAALTETIRTIQGTAGAVMDPFSAWLALRGMRTLAVRLRQQCATAHTLADFLAGHPAVERVHFPGLPAHPGHAVAARQMASYGAMLSFEVAGGAEAAVAVAARVQTFRRATSLGGTESLIEHRASIEAPPSRAPVGLLRVSVGLEHEADLLADLSRALPD